MALGSQLSSGRDVHTNAPRQHIETASKANPVTRLSIEILSIILSFIHDDEESRSTLFLPFLRVSKAWMYAALPEVHRDLFLDTENHISTIAQSVRIHHSRGLRPGAWIRILTFGDPLFSQPRIEPTVSAEFEFILHTATGLQELEFPRWYTPPSMVGFFEPSFCNTLQVLNMHCTTDSIQNVRIIGLLRALQSLDIGTSECVGDLWPCNMMPWLLPDLRRFHITSVCACGTDVLSFVSLCDMPVLEDLGLFLPTKVAGFLVQIITSHPLLSRIGLALSDEQCAEVLPYVNAKELCVRNAQPSLPQYLCESVEELHIHLRPEIDLASLWGLLDTLLEPDAEPKLQSVKISVDDFDFLWISEGDRDGGPAYAFLKTSLLQYIIKLQTKRVRLLDDEGLELWDYNPAIERQH